MKVHHHRHNPHLLQKMKQEAMLLDELNVPEKKNSGTARHTTAPTSQVPLRTHAAQQAAASAMAEQLEQQQRRDEQRNQIRLQRTSKNPLKFSHILELATLLEGQAGNQQQAREAAITRLVTEQGSDADMLEEILALVDNDPASAYVTMNLLVQRLRHSDQPELAEKVNQLLNQLQQHQAEKISAGINTASAMAAFSTDPRQKKRLRQLYYDGVVGQQSADSIMDLLLSKFGVEGFLPALRTLQRALADDIAAFAPSMPAMTLRRLLSGLNDTRAISHTLTEVDMFLDRLKQTFGDITVSSDTLARALLGMCRNGVYSNDLVALGAQVVGEQPQRQPLFFSSLFSLLQRLPHAIWGDEGKHRQNAMQLLRVLNGELAAWEKQQLAYR